MAFGAQGEDSVVGRLVAKNTKEVKGSPIFTIGDKTFEIHKMNHLKVFDLLPLIGDLLLVPLAYGMSPSAVDNISNEEDLIDEMSMMDNLPDMVALLFTKLREAPVKELITEMLSCVHLKGSNSPVDINKDFDEAADITIALCEVVTVHYAPFISRVFKSDILANLAMVAQLKTSLK